MLIKHISMSLLLLLAISTSARGDLIVSAVEITAFGLFQGYDKQFERAYDDHGPATDSLSYVRFTDFKDQIPGQVGINFGFQYIIHSYPKGAPIKVTGVIKYPQPGLKSPSGDIYQRSEETMVVKLGEKNFYGFGFDHDWEIIPGKWVFQILLNGHLLAEKEFIVEEMGTAS